MSSSSRTAEEVIKKLKELGLPKAAAAIAEQEKEKHKSRYGARDIVEAIIAVGYTKVNRMWALGKFGYNEKHSIVITLKNEGKI